VRDLMRATYGALLRIPRSATGIPLATPFRCLLCEGRRAHELFPEAIPESRGFHVVRCDDCGLVATHPVPAPEDIPGFYGGEYYGEQNQKFGRLTETFITLFRFARRRALRLAGVRHGGTLLDVGCGRGRFLSIAARAGYVVYGTELTDESARAARHTVGEDRVRVGTLARCGFAPGRFDAVTMWHVFEHLPDPGETLDECHRLLRPGGTLVLSVPNIESWQARWAGGSWFHLDMPRHLVHYSPETLTAMLARHGFRIEALSHFSLEQNPFGLLQSGLHQIGRPHFGLYRLLRGPLDRHHRSRARRLPGYLAYLAAFPVAAVVCYAGSILRSGATFTAIARRV